MPQPSETTAMHHQVVGAVDRAMAPKLADGADGNFAYSPSSIAAALTLLRIGTVGDAASQLDALLGTSGRVQATEAAGALHAMVAALGGGEGPGGGPSVNLADALFPDRSLRLDSAFVETLEAAASGVLRSVDYRSDSEAAWRAVNGWVAERTGGLIADLLPRSVIDTSTRFVIVDALHLAARWANQFSVDRRAIAFHHPDGSTTEPAMFSGVGDWAHRIGDDYTTVAIPYRQSSLVFRVVMPGDGGLEVIEQRFFTGGLDSELAAADRGRVQLTWPGCRIDGGFDLQGVLVNLGVTAIFEDPTSLAGIVEPVDGEAGIVVSAVRHRAVVTADRHGTEAAAATGVVAMLTGTLIPPDPPTPVVIDRPYLFRIEDQDSGMVLFTGRVVDPAGP